MHYTIQEAVQRQDFTLLSREQENEILNLVGTDNDAGILQMIRYSDVPAGFVNEDEAHTPAAILHEYEYVLLNGTKQERADVLRLMKQDLDEHAMQLIRSAESGMEEWNKLAALAKTTD